MIQDCISRNLIGVGRAKEGDFLHQKILHKNCQVHAVKIYDLWHGRLGHPSGQVLALLGKSLNVGDVFNNKVDELCDVCFHAKQTR